MSLALSYARALFEAASENQEGGRESLDQLEKQMGSVGKLFEESKELQVALFSPLTEVREKDRCIEEISKKLGILPLLRQFLLLLAKKGRLGQFQAIQEGFRTVRLSAEGGVVGHLVAAEPISEADQEVLVKAFSQKLGKKVAFHVSSDPSLLAGIKVTVNGVTYDGTLRSQLQSLRDRCFAGVTGTA